MYQMGIPIIDYMRQEVAFDTPVFREAAKLYGLLDAINYTAVYPPGAPYSSTPTEEMYAYKILMHIRGSSGFAQASREVLEHDDTPVFFPLRAEDGSIRVRVTNAAAIRNSSPNRQNAWNFIKLLLDDQGQINTPYFCTPVNTEIAKRRIQAGMKEMSFTNPAPPLPEELQEEYLRYFNEIGGAYFRTPLIFQLDEALKPFYKGEMSYDDCVENLRQRLEIYVSE